MFYLLIIKIINTKLILILYAFFLNLKCQSKVEVVIILIYIIRVLNLKINYIYHFYIEYFKHINKIECEIIFNNNYALIYASNNFLFVGFLEL